MTDRLTRALEHLPHGPEFRFVDRLTELDPGRSGGGVYRVPGDAEYLRGHFPGDPIMPGVLILEAAAQLAGVVAQSDPDLTPLVGLKLTAIRGVKLLGTAQPGQTLTLQATIQGRMGNLVQAQVEARVNGKRVMQCVLTLGGEEGPAAD